MSSPERRSARWARRGASRVPICISAWPSTATSSIRRCFSRHPRSLLRARGPAAAELMAEAGDAGRDTGYMRLALEQAAAAGARGEVPVGAVLVRGTQVIASGGNAPIATHDPTAHAEVQALRAGGRALGSYRLTDTTLYVTLEPCVMCAAAIVHARVRRLVFGAWDPRAGAAGSITDVFTLPQLNHRVDVFGGVLIEECGRLLRQFFAERR